MLGISAVSHELPSGERDSPRVPAARSNAAGALAVAPFGVALVMLLIAVWSDGAFALRHWGPVALFVLAVLVFVRTGWPGGRGAAALVLATWAFAAWSTLSAWWAVAPGAALEGGARNVLYAGLVSLPLLTLPDRVWAVRAARAVGIGLAALVAATVVACISNGAEHFLAGRLNDPIEYRNATAALFGLAFWPLLSVAAHRGANPLLRAGAFSGAVFALGFAFLTQSRGILLGFACGAVVALALGPDRLRRAWLTLFAGAMLAISSQNLLEPYDAFIDTGDTVPSTVIGAMTTLTTLSVAGFVASLVLALFDGGLRVKPSSERTLRRITAGALALLTIAAVVGGLAVAGNPVSLVRDKAEEFKQLDVAAPGETRFGSTGGQRYDLWRIALLEFRDRPVTGVGESGYPARYYVERRTDRNVSTPHSLAFATLAELGIVGLLLLLAIPAAAVAALASGWRTATPAERRWASALAAGATVMLAQASVDWLWQIPGLMGLGLLCLATSVACVSAPAPAPGVPRRWRTRRWRVAAAAVPLLGVLFMGALYLSDVYSRSARAERGGTPAAQLENARTAARFNPVALAPRYLEAGALETLGRRPAARAALEDALAVEPANFVTMALLGDLETRAGRPAAARVWYERALAGNPGDVGLQQLAGRAPS